MPNYSVSTPIIANTVNALIWPACSAAIIADFTKEHNDIALRQGFVGGAFNIVMILGFSLFLNYCGRRQDQRLPENTSCQIIRKILHEEGYLELVAGATLLVPVEVIGNVLIPGDVSVKENLPYYGYSSAAALSVAFLVGLMMFLKKLCCSSMRVHADVVENNSVATITVFSRVNTLNPDADVSNPINQL